MFCVIDLSFELILNSLIFSDCKLIVSHFLKFIGACKNPIMVIATELLPGTSLKKYLSSIKPQQLDIHTAVSYALDIARAMDCLHANGIIHRDLKPGKRTHNLVLSLSICVNLLSTEALFMLGLDIG
jgi:serine/threonine protein kinase